MSHDKEWDEKDVELGRQLVAAQEDAAWALGDLANKVCPAGPTGIYDEGRLQTFADTIGASRTSLLAYRRVAAAWPASTRVEAQTFTTHKMLAAHPDRFEILAEQTWTYNSLADRLGRLPNPSRVNRETGEILDDLTPAQVHQAIKRDPAIAQQARKALDERYDDSPKPISPAVPSVADDAADLVHEFRDLHKGVDRIVQLVNSGKAVVNDSTRDAILREVKWLTTALGYIQDGVTSNSLEAEIASFLQEQS